MTAIIPNDTAVASKSVKQQKLLSSYHHSTPLKSTNSVQGRKSLKSEHKSRFKLVRLRTPSYSRPVSRDTGIAYKSTGLQGLPHLRPVQRCGSCEKRVTRYKMIRVRKKTVNNVMNKSHIKLKTRYKLVRAKQPCKTPLRRISVHQALRKQTRSVVNHKLSRQLIRTEDGTVMLKGRFHLVKNTGSRLPWQQMAGTVHKKTGCRLSHEPKVRQHQVTVQAAAQ